MRATELIAILQMLVEKHGDLTVTVFDTDEYRPARALPYLNNLGYLEIEASWDHDLPE